MRGRVRRRDAASSLANRCPREYGLRTFRSRTGQSDPANSHAIVLYEPNIRLQNDHPQRFLIGRCRTPRDGRGAFVDDCLLCMYLSTLDLHGFKSFAEKTTLAFDPGVTAIVGPNGCGKSNIVDAVRWVIGEQRPTVLRSEKMQNVIFNGTADRRPLGMAEVQLTIENTRGVLPTEYTEVTIGRRLFRDGASEYLLNGTQCRLKDITDLFMDTGMGADAYSVIELAMVDEILSGSTDDRRRMFEEAAGITRYKKRRRQALRKLEGTQSDLERVQDLTDEIRSHVTRLQKQARRAETYKEAATELEQLTLQMAQIRFNRLTEQRAIVAEREAQHIRQMQAARQSEAEAEGQVAALRRQVTEREAALDDRRSALHAHRDEVRTLEAEQRVQRERLNQARRDRNRTQKAQHEAATEREALVETSERLSAALDDVRPKVDDANAALSEARKARDAAQDAAKTLRGRVRALRQKASAAERKQADRRRTLDRLTNRRELKADEYKRAQSQRDALQADADALDERVAEAKARHTTAQEVVTEARDALDAADAERATRYEALEAAKDTFRAVERDRDAAQAEVDLLEGLVSSYEAFPDAVQFLAGEGPLDALHTVADVLACDDDIRVALDTALGDLASCIVVDTDAEARAAIAHLRDNNRGQARFLVQRRLPDVPAPFPAPDGCTSLRTHVRTDDVHASLADVLLHHHYLVETLAAAQSVIAEVPAGARVIAQTGEWVDTRGIQRGGSQRKTTSPVASRLGRREQLATAHSQLEALNAQYQCKHDVVEDAQQALAAIDLQPHRTAVREAEQTLRQAEKQWERVQYERETLRERREDVRDRIDALQKEQADLSERIETLRTDVEAAEDDVNQLRERQQKAQDALDDAEERERTAVDAYNDARVAALDLRNQRQNLEREHKRTDKRIATIDRQQEERAETLAALAATIEDALDTQTALDARIDEVRQQRHAYEDAVDEAAAAVRDTKAAITNVEATLRRLRNRRDQAIERRNNATVRTAEIDTRLEELVEGTHEETGRHLPEQPVPLPDDVDPEAMEEKIKRLRGRINAIGSVNPLAKEEYESEKERLDFLEEQQADLAAAEETLLETISEINATASTRFLQTYDAIQQSFSDLFTELFGRGASARLELDNPEAPLDTAIDIIAQPRGKRPVTLDQLSSGEKTLTAIALLFAIYLVKPSPFCILDEVDAPLDDANVERFMRLVRRFEDDTQFILVTHNQRTMALADRLYGVTMQERGISTLVSVAFDEAVALSQ